MTHAPAEAEKSIRNAVENKKKRTFGALFLFERILRILL